MKAVVSFGLGFSLCCSSFAGPVYLYQAPLGALTSYSAPFANWQYLGVRFAADVSEQITSIQTEAAEYSPGSSTYFAALIRLPSVNSLPQGNPFTGQEVVYSTLFSLSGAAYSWQSLNIPFDVTIDPGAYAIVLGAGSFGSSGPIDGLLRVYQKTSDSTAFGWGDGGYGWNVNTAYTWNISVVGTPVPEPSAMEIGSACLLLAFLLGPMNGPTGRWSEPRDDAPVDWREPEASAFTRKLRRDGPGHSS